VQRWHEVRSQVQPVSEPKETGEGAEVIGWSKRGFRRNEDEANARHQDNRIEGDTQRQEFLATSQDKWRGQKQEVNRHVNQDCFGDERNDQFPIEVNGDPESTPPVQRVSAAVDQQKPPAPNR